MLETPDEKSIMTYLVGYYHKFAQMELDNLGNKRLQKVIGFQMEVEQEEEHFELKTADLLNWVMQSKSKLLQFDFPNSVSGVQACVSDFKAYRTIEKPPRFAEKGLLEAQLFKIQMQLRESNRKQYEVPEDKELRAINSNWDKLEEAEHLREEKLKAELVRQERLQLSATILDRKAAMREAWLQEMHNHIKSTEFGKDLASVMAARKREDTFELQVQAYEPRLLRVFDLAAMLVAENYYEAGKLKARSDAIGQMWSELKTKMAVRRALLDNAYYLSKALVDVDQANAWIDETSAQAKVIPKGKDVSEADENVAKHKMNEVAITSMESSVSANMERLIKDFQSRKHPSEIEIRAHRDDLKDRFARLRDLSSRKGALLAEWLDYHRFVQDVQDEYAWIRDNERAASSTDLGSNMNMTVLLQRKHDALRENIDLHKSTVLKDVLDNGRKLIKANNYSSAAIEKHIASLTVAFDKLQDTAAQRDTALRGALMAEQYVVEANEIESWIAEKENVVSNDDVGKDEHGAAELIKKHEVVQSEVVAFQPVFKRLQEQSQKVSASEKYVCMCVYVRMCLCLFVCDVCDVCDV